MNSNNYISDYKLDAIRKEYGEKIIAFSKVQQQIKGWYKKFAFVFTPESMPKSEFIYPHSSINNYRDSWFHYRKIWTERSRYESICHIATLEEHLQRSEKDAVVNFFQIISQDLDFWYCIETQDLPETFQEHIEIKSYVNAYYEKSKQEERENGQWLISLWDTYGLRDQEASFALIYAVQIYFSNFAHVKKQLQELLHLIKNTTLKMRFDASDIRRLEYPGEYVQCCQDSYNAICSFFNEGKNPGIYFLLGITKVVISNIK